jgi:hypothetical protein
MHHRRKVRIERVRLMTEEEKSLRRRRLLGIKHDSLMPADDQFVTCLRDLNWINNTRRLWNRRMTRVLTGE